MNICKVAKKCSILISAVHQTNPLNLCMAVNAVEHRHTSGNVIIESLIISSRTESYIP